MSLVDDLAKLEELRRKGALSEAEFTNAKGKLLSGAPDGGPQLGEHLADQLAEVRHQNELAQIDREWEIERQQYLIRSKYGIAHVPSVGMGIGTAVFGGAFGLFWTIMATATTWAAPDVGPFSIAKIVFPLFGIIFIVAAISYGAYCVSKAKKYQEAFDAYKARRARGNSE
jgi:hypothetical protein